VTFIEIGRRNHLLYLVLPHPLKIALLSADSHAKLDRINLAFNERAYSGEAATRYDELHRYAEAEQHEYPGKLLVADVWAYEDYGRALELGAGSGYFTALIARRARSVFAVEPVADLATVLRSRCEAKGLDNIQVVEASALDLDRLVDAGSVDSAFVIQSLHHFHRRPEVFASLGRAVRPGGRLLLLEPHHNLRRVVRLFRTWRRSYRLRGLAKLEQHWATHDFLTCGEVRALCRLGGFERVRIEGYWVPYARRLVPSPERRYRLERALGRIPGVRHFAGVLAVEARRGVRGPA